MMGRAGGLAPPVGMPPGVRGGLPPTDKDVGRPSRNKNSKGRKGRNDGPGPFGGPGGALGIGPMDGGMGAHPSMVPPGLASCNGGMGGLLRGADGLATSGPPNAVPPGGMPGMGGAPPPYPPQMPFVLQPPNMQPMAPYGMPPNMTGMPPGMQGLMYQGNMYQPAGNIYQPPPGSMGGQYGGGVQPPQYVGAPGGGYQSPQQPWQNPSANPGSGGYGYQQSMGGMPPQQGGLGMGGPGMGGPGGPPYPSHSTPGFVGDYDPGQPPFDSNPPSMPFGYPYRGA